MSSRLRGISGRATAHARPLARGRGKGEAEGLMSIRKPQGVSATRVSASAIGAFGGLAGVIHGLFEILQGDVTHSSAVINAIGPSQRLWPDATLHALTLLPSFLVAGILTVIVALLVTIWAAAFIDLKHSAGVLLLLSIILLLVGGGFGPAFMAMIGSLVATQIGKPLSWWHAHLPSTFQNFLVKLWPWALVTYLLFFSSSVGIAVFGIPLVWFISPDRAYGILLNLGPISDILLLVGILSAFAYDIRQKASAIQASSVQGRMGIGTDEPAQE
jgi:hypothetical protein